MIPNESMNKAFERLYVYVSNKLKGYVPITGGTLTGDLTGKKITGTILQTTEAAETTSATKICVLKDDNCIHWIHTDNLVGDGVVLEGEYATKEYVDSLMLVDELTEV